MNYPLGSEDVVNDREYGRILTITAWKGVKEIVFAAQEKRAREF